MGYAKANKQLNLKVSCMKLKVNNIAFFSGKLKEKKEVLGNSKGISKVLYEQK